MPSLRDFRIAPLTQGCGAGGLIRRLSLGLDWASGPGQGFLVHAIALGYLAAEPFNCLRIPDLPEPFHDLLRPTPDVFERHDVNVRLQGLSACDGHDRGIAAPLPQ